MTKTPRKNRITKNTLDKMSADIETLASTPPDDFSAKEAVRHLLPSILKALENGRSMEQINETLAKRGLQITAATLATYVREARHDTGASAADVTPDSRDDEAPNKEPEAQADNRGENRSSINFVPMDEVEESDLQIRPAASEAALSIDDVLSKMSDEPDWQMSANPTEGKKQDSSSE